MFHQFCVTAVLDWELSTLGDPILDLAYSCIPYHWPKELDFDSRFSLGMFVVLDLLSIIIIVYLLDKQVMSSLHCKTVLNKKSKNLLFWFQQYHDVLWVISK